jgi:Ca2+-binding EF-hand superfamily protein
MRSLDRLILTGTCAGSLLVASSGTLAAQGGSVAERFRGMDRDGDGVITRAEWRGNDQSFRVHDWNGDGVLSGAEVRAEQGPYADDSADAVADQGRNTDWSAEGFARLDRDGDGRITQREWRYGADLFSQIDRDRDQQLSESEFLGVEADREILDRFDYLDQNRDGVLTMNEWQRNEWSFRRRDLNRDGVITRGEFTPQQRGQNAAYRSGYDRGLLEGRNAGSEDKRLRNRWDLDGQQELERADSGYTPAAGALADYQAGYRAGFRVGYEEGFGRR